MKYCEALNILHSFCFVFFGGGGGVGEGGSRP